ncbi:MAG: DsrE family protein [Denitrovibrio sp.]|nr:MAG: DsrE family protein [Denitrovibrio sp.]
MNENTLVVVWTSGDPEVAKKMVFMYTYNAKKYGWWENVIFIVWGPSAQLMTHDEELQRELQKFYDIGITVKACKACADMYDASDKLEILGMEVEYMGIPLTNYVKKGYKVLTF